MWEPDALMQHAKMSVLEVYMYNLPGVFTTNFFADGINKDHSVDCSQKQQSSNIPEISALDLCDSDAGWNYVSASL